MILLTVHSIVKTGRRKCRLNALELKSTGVLPNDTKGKPYQGKWAFGAVVDTTSPHSHLAQTICVYLSCM